MTLDSQTPPTTRPSPLGDPQRRGRIIIGGISLLAALGYWWLANGMPQGAATRPGPGMWPNAVGAVWALISIIVTVEAILTSQVGGDTDFPTGRQRRDVSLFYLATVGFVVIIPILGMYLASTVYVATLLTLISKLPLWKIIVYGVGIGLAIPWLFINLLQIRLPLGFIGDLL